MNGRLPTAAPWLIMLVVARTANPVVSIEAVHLTGIFEFDFFCLEYRITVNTSNADEKAIRINHDWPNFVITASANPAFIEYDTAKIIPKPDANTIAEPINIRVEARRSILGRILEMIFSSLFIFPTGLHNHRVEKAAPTTIT